MGLPQRKSNRLRGYDYSQNGLYFITVCVEHMEKRLSFVGDGFPVPRLTEQGTIVEAFLEELSKKYPQAQVEKAVIMPNHLHLLLRLDDAGTRDPSNGTRDPSNGTGDVSNGTGDVSNGTGNPSPTVGTECGPGDVPNGTGDPSPTVGTERGTGNISIGTVMGWFKYQTTKAVNTRFGMPGEKLWQRSFYDHVIRNEQDFLRISSYIDSNPVRWEQDRFYCP